MWHQSSLYRFPIHESRITTCRMDPSSATQTQFNQSMHPALQTVLNHTWQKIINRTDNSNQPRPASASEEGLHMLALHILLTIPSTSDYELWSWIADMRSGMHVCNNLSHFQHLEEVIDGSRLCFEDQTTLILGYRTVMIYGTLPQGQMTLRLQNIIYVSDLHINIVSMFKAKQAGIYISGRFNCLEDGQGRMICCEDIAILH